MSFINELSAAGLIAFNADFSQGSLRDSVSGNIGTPTNTWWTSVNKTRAIAFRQTGSLVSYPGTTGNDLSGTESTLIFCGNLPLAAAINQRLMVRRVPGGALSYDVYYRGAQGLAIYSLATGSRWGTVPIFGKNMVAITLVNGATPKGYADGNYVCDMTGTLQINALAGTTVYVGNYEVNGGSYVKADFCRTILISKALSPSQISTLYEELTQPSSYPKTYSLPGKLAATPDTYYGKELLVDGDMEAVGVAAWTVVGAGATRTKQAAFATGTQCLRINTTNIYTGVSNTVIPGSAGQKVKVTGWARGDGTLRPMINIGGNVVSNWIGTSSNTPQRIDTELTTDGITNQTILLLTRDAGAGYIEFDDMSFRLVGGAANLQLHWLLDKPIPGTMTVADLSGNNRNGTATGIGIGQGLVSKSVCSLNGIDPAKISRAGGSTETLASSSQYCVSVWFKARSLANNPAIIGTDTVAGLLLQVSSGGVIYWYNGTVGRSHTGTVLINTWYHLLVEKTGTGDNGNLYLNNVKLVVAGGTIGNISATPGALYVGTYGAATTNVLNGDIQDLRIYSQNLSSTERTSLYQEGARRLTFQLPMRGETEVTLAAATTVEQQVGNSPWKIFSSASSFTVEELSVGKKFLCSTTALKEAYIPFGNAYGTWVFETITGASGSMGLLLETVSNTKAYYSDATNNGYLFQLAGLGVLFFTITAGVGTQIYGSGNILARSTNYTFAISRTNASSFSIYIKGGTYSQWTLMPILSGANPVTPATVYTTSSYIKVQQANNGTMNLGALHFHEGVLSLADLNEMYP